VSSPKCSADSCSSNIGLGNVPYNRGCKSIAGSQNLLAYARKVLNSIALLSHSQQSSPITKKIDASPLLEEVDECVNIVYAVNTVNNVNNMARQTHPVLRSSARREKERLLTRNKIMNVARELFVREGYEAVTLRRIAGAISYTAPAIYRHFSDKEQLIREICQVDFGRFANRFQSALTIADPVERLRAIGKAYVQFGVKNPNHYRLMFMVGYGGRPNSDQYKTRGNPAHDAYAALQHTVAAIIKARRVRATTAHAELLCQTFWAGVHGVVSLEICKERHRDWVEWAPLERRTDMIIDAMISGLTVKR
jgi:AcrR family transcriptional regulator